MSYPQPYYGAPPLQQQQPLIYVAAAPPTMVPVVYAPVIVTAQGTHPHHDSPINPSLPSGLPPQQPSTTNPTPNDNLGAELFPPPGAGAGTGIGMSVVVNDLVAGHMLQSTSVAHNIFLGENAGDAGRCKYYKEKLLGSGISGHAYLVRRSCDGASLVAKIIDVSTVGEKNLRYAQREARCLACCESPFVIKFIEHYADSEVSILITEYADAKDLSSHMKKMKNVFTEREAGVLFVQILMGLFHIHSKKILHRDIKARNIFLCTSGLVKLGDFGFSKAQESTVEQEGTFLGTPCYISPEMWCGHKYGPKADIWAAGVILHEMVTGSRPFSGATHEALRQSVLSNRREPLPQHFSLSKDISLLLDTLLEPEVSKRPKCYQVLAMPIVQHYMELLLYCVTRDQSFSASLRTTILSTIMEVQKQVEERKQLTRIREQQQLLQQQGGGGGDGGNGNGNPRGMSPNSSYLSQAADGDCVVDCRYDGAVYKSSDGGTWKERHLSLTPQDLTVSLPAKKVSAPGSDRSRSLPVSAIEGVVLVQELTGPDRWVFDVEFEKGQVLRLATKTEAERMIWMSKIQFAIDGAAVVLPTPPLPPSAVPAGGYANNNYGTGYAGGGASP